MKALARYLLLLPFVLALAPALAQDKKAASPAQEEEEIDVPPPAVGGAAGSRSGGISRAANDKHPSIFVIAPMKKGATAQESPVLYWYLSDDTDQPIELTISKNRGPTVLRKTLEGSKGGLHKLDLSKETGPDGRPAALEPETDYRFTAKIRSAGEDAEENPDFRGRGNNVSSTAWIWRLKTSQPAALINGASDAKALAKQGLWYDTFAALCARIEKEPDNSTFHKQRLSMLKKEKVLEMESDGDQRVERGEARLRSFVEREAVKKAGREQ